ncbi:MAG: hypothetical protein Q7V53_01085 [Caldisericota bacterium]|nr:hypothetical protein [Caldisericota bacterium]
MDGHVLVVTGPRASGKTTCSRTAHDGLPGSLLLHVDDLFHSIIGQDRGRWDGREADLYALVLYHELLLARRLAVECGVIIVDATLLPDQLEPLVTGTDPPIVEVLVLLPPLATCLDHETRTGRTVPACDDKVRTTWQEMQAWRTNAGEHVTLAEKTGYETLATLALVVQRLLSSGAN